MIIMGKIGVLGRRESILYFRAMGLYTQYADDRDSAKAMLEKMVKDGYSVIYVSNETAVEIADEIYRYKDKPDVAVVVLPSKSKNDIAEEMMKSAVERALGADMQ